MTIRLNPKIGAHVSIAGGIWNAPARAAAEGCETFQCFTRSPQGGAAPKLTEEVVIQFKSEMKMAGLSDFYVHAPYYINLASANSAIRQSSIRVIREELERGSILGAKYVMAHPGSHSGQTLPEAITLVQDAISKILDGYVGSCEFLVEISAGAGSVLGDTFQEIADMIRDTRQEPRFGGVCFDTCHAFASGYDFRTSEKTISVLKEFDELIGLEWLKLTHVNDSQADLGGYRDRHAHIGYGHIGLEGLTPLLRSSSFDQIDWILETESSGRASDIEALKNIRNRP